MNTTLRQQMLAQVITVIRSARPLVEAIERKDRDLGSQLKRSLNGTALNVGEAFGVHAGNARLSFRRALGELYESQASLLVAAAWGYVGDDSARAVVTDLAALGGRLYGLSRRWRQRPAARGVVGAKVGGLDVGCRAKIKRPVSRAAECRPTGLSPGRR